MVLDQLFQNAVFWSVLLAGALSQGTKILVLMLRHRQSFHPNDLVVTGGMPSTHSALVSALALITYLTEGFSALFFVTLVIAAIVLRDALGVRRSVGEEGKLLNQVIARSKLKLPRLHYSLGHTPMEVAVGVAIGLLSAGIAFAL